VTTPVVASAGGWLPIGGLTVSYASSTETWLVDGFLDEPSARISGIVDLDDGELVSASLQIPNVNVGSVATMTLTLTYEVGGTFSLAAALVGPDFAGRPNGTGSLTFVNRAITAGSLRFGSLPIGELFTLEPFQLTYSNNPSRWAASGTIVGATGSDDPTSIAGAFTFTGGVLTDAEIRTESLSIGPIVVDTFAMTLNRGAGSGPRESSFALSGTVRGPAVSGGTGTTASIEPISGAASLLDGRLTAFGLSIPHLELPGLAYLENVTVGYAVDGSAARLNGSGTVKTAGDGAGAGPAGTFVVRMDDGRVTHADLNLTRLPLAGLLTISSFTASFNATGGPVGCTVANNRTSDIYVLGGTVRSSNVEGCIALDGRRLVGAQLGVDRLQVGELLVVDDFAATFTQGESYVASLVGGTTSTVALHRASFTVSGTLASRGGPPTTINGSLVLIDGGVDVLDLQANMVPLSSTVRLEQVVVSFERGGRFDGAADLEFKIDGRARHSGGTTTASGGFVFSPDGALQTAFVDVGNLPFEPIVLEDFAFRYDRTRSTTSWSIDARVTAPDNRAVSGVVTGNATFVNGALTSAGLAIPQLSVGELVMLTEANLGFARLADGSEVWSGEAESPDSARSQIRRPPRSGSSSARPDSSRLGRSRSATCGGAVSST
jgi:hypothetical protein